MKNLFQNILILRNNMSKNTNALNLVVGNILKDFKIKLLENNVFSTKPSNLITYEKPIEYTFKKIPK